MLILLMENILPQVQHEIFRDSVQLNSTYTCLPLCEKVIALLNLNLITS